MPNVFLFEDTQFFDNSGNPLNGGKIYTYSAGGTVPLAAYTDSTGTSAHPNPIILGSDGRVQIWLTANSYHIVIANASGTTLKDLDNVNVVPPAGTLSTLTVTGNSVLDQTVAATALANQSSHPLTVRGTIWDGTKTVNDEWAIQNVVGTGSNPTSTLQFSHSGSTGTATLSAQAFTISSLNAQKFENIRFADQFASLQAAHDDLPAGGGTVFVPITATPFGAANTTGLTISKPIHIIFDNAAFTYAGTGHAITSAAQAGIHIEGSASPDLNNPTKGTSITISGTNVNGIDLTGASLIMKNFDVIGPGSGTGVGIIVSGNGFYAENVQVKSFGGDGWQINGTRANTNNFVMNRCRSYSNGGIGFNTFGTDSNLGVWINTSGQSNTGVNYTFNGNINQHFDALHSQPSTDATSITFVGSSGNEGTVYVEPVTPFAANAITFDATSKNNNLMLMNGRLVGNTAGGVGNSWVFKAPDFTPSTSRHVWNSDSNTDSVVNKIFTFDVNSGGTTTTDFGMFVKSASLIAGPTWQTLTALNFSYGKSGNGQSANFYSNPGADISGTAPILSLNTVGLSMASGGMLITEGTGQGGVAGKGSLWADSTAHRLKMNPNNQGAWTIPGTVDSSNVDLTGQSATLADQTIITGGTGTGGHYVVHIQIYITATDASGATVTGTVKFTTEGIARTYSLGAQGVNSTANFTVGSVCINADASTNITVGATVTGAPTTGRYAIHAWASRQ